jgi:hypothetical protein
MVIRLAVLAFRAVRHQKVLQYRQVGVVLVARPAAVALAALEEAVLLVAALTLTPWQPVRQHSQKVMHKPRSAVS